MALFCRKRSSRETERWRGVHKLNFKFSSWITIVSHAPPHNWVASEKTHLKQIRIFFLYLLPIFYILALLLAQTQFTFCHFHLFFFFIFTKQACSLFSGGWVNGCVGPKISFSGSCHEGRYGGGATPLSEDRWTGVEKCHVSTTCGWIGIFSLCSWWCFR